MGDSAERLASRRQQPLRAAAVVAAVALLGCVVWMAAVRRGETSRTNTCLMNLSSLAKAMRLYTLDYNDHIFFGEGDAFAPPLARDQAGQTPYLKQAMEKYIPDQSIWYCPADDFAARKVARDPKWHGTFTYDKAGIGYRPVPHGESLDPGIQALRCQLTRDYGADHMRVDHAFSSYRFVPGFSGEERPVYIDACYRVFQDDARVPGYWGAYGYWDINPSSAWLFEEDLPYHFHRGTGSGYGYRLFGRRFYGKSYGFRDGHSVFHTYTPIPIWNDGESNEVY